MRAWNMCAGRDVLVLELLRRHVSNISCETEFGVEGGGEVEVLLNVTGGERLLFS
jgi:hypothetical protein